jgi:hypothetical protein
MTTPMKIVRLRRDAAALLEQAGTMLNLAGMQTSFYPSVPALWVRAGDDDGALGGLRVGIIHSRGEIRFTFSTDCDEKVAAVARLVVKQLRKEES